MLELLFSALFKNFVVPKYITNSKYVIETGILGGLVIFPYPRDIYGLIIAMQIKECFSFKIFHIFFYVYLLNILKTSTEEKYLYINIRVSYKTILLVTMSVFL